MVTWITDAHAQGLPEQRACAVLAITLCAASSAGGNRPCRSPRERRGHGKPDTDWVTGPNQLLAWDVTWLTTAARGVYPFVRRGWNKRHAAQPYSSCRTVPFPA